MKVEGAGNDFVLIPDLADAVGLTPHLVRAICDRRRGIGADGVIRLAPPRDGVDADVFMDYRNADGSIAEMCGNGVRTVALFAVGRGLSAHGDAVAVDTRGGVKDVLCHRAADGTVVSSTVDMGTPEVMDADRQLDLADGTTVRATLVSMGNPHAVIVVDDVDAAPLEAIAAQLQDHDDFPDGVNVEVISPLDRASLRGRILERGVGETLASGTGASAMAVAAITADLTDRHVAVHVPGGRLDVEWRGHDVFLTGPATEVAHGVLDARWLAAVAASEPDLDDPPDPVEHHGPEGAPVTA